MRLARFRPGWINLARAVLLEPGIEKLKREVGLQ
jgi:hypothetical protein